MATFDYNENNILEGVSNEKFTFTQGEVSADEGIQYAGNLSNYGWEIIGEQPGWIKLSNMYYDSNLKRLEQRIEFEPHLGKKAEVELSGDGLRIDLSTGSNARVELNPNGDSIIATIRQESIDNMFTKMVNQIRPTDVRSVYISSWVNAPEDITYQYNNPIYLDNKYGYIIQAIGDPYTDPIFSGNISITEITGDSNNRSTDVNTQSTLDKKYNFNISSSGNRPVVNPSTNASTNESTYTWTISPNTGTAINSPISYTYTFTSGNNLLTYIGNSIIGNISKGLSVNRPTEKLFWVRASNLESNYKDLEETYQNCDLKTDNFSGEMTPYLYLSDLPPSLGAIMLTQPPAEFEDPKYEWKTTLTKNIIDFTINETTGELELSETSYWKSKIKNVVFVDQSEITIQNEKTLKISTTCENVPTKIGPYYLYPICTNYKDYVTETKGNGFYLGIGESGTKYETYTKWNIKNNSNPNVIDWTVNGQVPSNNEVSITTYNYSSSGSHSITIAREYNNIDGNSVDINITSDVSEVVFTHTEADNSSTSKKILFNVSTSSVVSPAPYIITVDATVYDLNIGQRDTRNYKINLHKKDEIIKTEERWDIRQTGGVGLFSASINKGLVTIKTLLSTTSNRDLMKGVCLNGAEGEFTITYEAKIGGMLRTDSAKISCKIEPAKSWTPVIE